LETEPRFWIDARLIDVPVALIQSIEFKPAAGAAFALHRLNPADNSFSLDGVPAGRKPRMGTPWHHRRPCSRASMREDVRSDEQHRFRIADPGDRDAHGR